MKPIALAALVTTLLSACTTSATEERAAAHRAAVEQEAAARKAATASASTSASATTSLEIPPPAPPTEQHAWLQQLVGEWTFACKASMGEPFEMSGTESVRSVGGLWVLAEGRATVAGQPIQSLMTLGYDPESKAFVGTWVDSSQTELFHYDGALDDARKTLTLDTEGPSFDDPSKTSRYRDAIELTDKDHKVLTSSVQQPDGSWMTFMRAEFTRKR